MTLVKRIGWCILNLPCVIEKALRAELVEIGEHNRVPKSKIKTIAVSLKFDAPIYRPVRC